MLTTRQQYALLNPCRHAEEWNLGNYREEVARGQMRFYTFLAFNWFEKSKPLWNVGIAILEDNGDFKLHARWSHNDKNAALMLAVELLSGVGDDKGGFKVEKPNFIDFYRAATERDRDIARLQISQMPPLKTGFDLGPAKELYERNRVVEAEQGAGGSGGENHAIRRSRAERIGA